MFTNKDIEYRNIFVVNGVDKRSFLVQQGMIVVKDDTQNKILTKIPFQKVLILFTIGHITVTTALIDGCRKFGVALVVVKPTLRPVFTYSVTAEANFLLRKVQYDFNTKNISIAKVLIANKIINQIALLKKSRKKDNETILALETAKENIEYIRKASSLEEIMGAEGRTAKGFFTAYYSDIGWKGRYPRCKTDPLNATLDIGYTILFNFIECFAKLFGFDVYYGVCHQLWFRRKSLICDLMEPFRALVDWQVRKSFKLKEFKESDFLVVKNKYLLKPTMSTHYHKVFMSKLVEHKMDLFHYIRNYYRCFMGRKSVKEYPLFRIDKL